MVIVYCTATGETVQLNTLIIFLLAVLLKAEDEFGWIMQSAVAAAPVYSPVPTTPLEFTIVTMMKTLLYTAVSTTHTENQQIFIYPCRNNEEEILKLLLGK